MITRLTGKRIARRRAERQRKSCLWKRILKNLSVELTRSLGQGYSERSLREYRQFHLLFPDLWLIDISKEDKWRTPFAVSVNPIWRTAFAKLYWSHYQRVLRAPDQEARTYYLTETASENWSVSTLDRNISTLYYQRLLSSQDKAAVKKEMIENMKTKDTNPNDFIRNPTVLEFLNLPVNKAYTESQLEQGLVDNLQNFLLELERDLPLLPGKNISEPKHRIFILTLFFTILS